MVIVNIWKQRKFIDSKFYYDAIAKQYSLRIVAYLWS